MRIVFDLDGTLADTKHREHFIAPTDELGEDRPADWKPDWDAFFAACDGDAPMWPAITVLDALCCDGHQVEIWSGRGEGPDRSVREKTRLWLVNVLPNLNFVTYPPPQFFSYVKGVAIPIRMRAHGDYTPDQELKRKWLDECRDQGMQPELVFDDRARVVKMWRDAGIPCFQVAPGGF